MGLVNADAGDLQLILRLRNLTTGATSIEYPYRMTASGGPGDRLGMTLSGFETPSASGYTSLKSSRRAVGIPSWNVAALQIVEYKR